MLSLQPLVNTTSGELGCGELAALIGVDDLRRAVPRKRLLNHLLGMTGRQRDGHLVGQHLAAGHIHHRRQVHEASGHGDIRGIERPDLVGAGDGQLAQQVGVDLVSRVGLAGARLRAQGLYSIALHEPAHMTPANRQTVKPQHSAQHTRAHERVFQVQLVNAAHQRQIGLADRSGQVVHRAPAHAKQFGLPFDGQIVLTVNHRLSLRDDLHKPRHAVT